MKVYNSAKISLESAHSHIRNLKTIVPSFVGTPFLVPHSFPFTLSFIPATMSAAGPSTSQNNNTANGSQMEVEAPTVDGMTSRD